MEEKVFESSCATMYYSQDKYLIKIVWHGAISTEEYKKPFFALWEHAKMGMKVTRYLSDIRDQGIVSPENRKWFEKEMIPLAISYGLKRAAAISGSNAFKTYYINLILSSVNRFDLPFKVFNNEEKAIEFLMKE